MPTLGIPEQHPGDVKNASEQAFEFHKKGCQSNQKKDGAYFKILCLLLCACLFGLGQSSDCKLDIRPGLDFGAADLFRRETSFFLDYE